MKGEFTISKQKKGSKATAKPGYIVHPTDEAVQSQKRKTDEEESQNKRMKKEEDDKEVKMLTKSG